MSRSKKSRKEGALMKAILPKRTPKVEKEKRIRKKTGNKSGSRQDASLQNDKKSKLSSSPQDPRLGSKKPIALGVSESTHPKPPKAPKQQEAAIAPIRVVDNTDSLEQELLAIENDENLQLLAERDEAGEILSETEQARLQSAMTRYQELVALLGLEQEEEIFEEDTQISEDALWDKLDDYDFSDYEQDKK
ncbi:Der GTPase-activating protein YihI [Thalassotalea mangrovi]|uniref:GTPase-activating protein n=1 Tax=Thalassotalea mangrovi TaxID=2572245 RepID=A0A4U1B856_9GAMM|nr:Der GTPase-activating protein YihI [Thalassotalea mangrovi]TKB46824.1 GTPase-activating protein [Thalassotalea mangrovi]